MSYIYNISETTSLKRVINVNSKDSSKKNESGMIQDYKVDSFEHPEISAVITLVPERKPFTYHKPIIKKSKNKLYYKENESKILNKSKENTKKNTNDKVLTIEKYQTIKYIDKGSEVSKFRLFYNKYKNKVLFLSELSKYKDSKVNNFKNDAKDNNIISNVLPKLRNFKENYGKKIRVLANISYFSFSPEYKKTIKVYDSKKINLNIDPKDKKIKDDLVKYFKEINKVNKNKIDKNSYDVENDPLEDKYIAPVSIGLNKSKELSSKKSVYRHDAKVVYMKGFPLHNRCCENSKKISETKIDKKIEEIDDKGNKWKLLNDANESFPLVKFGKDIRNHFDFLNRTNKEDLHKIFISELGHVEMSIDGKSITNNKDPRVVLRKFRELLPNISDRKLVSCFAQEGVLAKAFFGVIAKYPDILKYTFRHPKISYKINRINENSFEVDICSITKARNYFNFNSNNISEDTYKSRIHSYGMKTNVVFSKISNPIIKNLFFIK
ncbi:MAG: hypothetical protein BucCj_3740 [Buchnera aphidicola (Ceratovacuna japonica)]